MKIELAENYGFCFGVKRAIKIAEENRDSATYGPLIHNSKEIARLEKDFQVGLVDDFTRFKKGDKAIVRTHGIIKNELQALYDRGVEVIDATCPFVTKPQEIAQEMSEAGYDVVIFGDALHPEIKGVESYAANGAFIVTDINELKKLKLRDKIALISQTTRKVEEYMDISNYLIPRYKEVRVFNTICNATFENQLAVRDISEMADVMIVIGGKNSSNTKQLFNIAKEKCFDSYHVEDESEIDYAWFKDKEFCAITAGASTPDWIIKNVIEAIRKRVD